MQTIEFKHGRASAKLERINSDFYSLRNLWSFDRGQGHASEVMRKIVGYADENNITLQLVVQRYGRPDATALDNKQLEGFYNKFGFARIPGRRTICMMVRQPSQEIHVP